MKLTIVYDTSEPEDLFVTYGASGDDNDDPPVSDAIDELAQARAALRALRAGLKRIDEYRGERPRRSEEPDE